MMVKLNVSAIVSVLKFGVQGVFN